jgi:hypothetical protein
VLTAASFGGGRRSQEAAEHAADVLARTGLSKPTCPQAPAAARSALELARALALSPGCCSTKLPRPNRAEVINWSTIAAIKPTLAIV